MPYRSPPFESQHRVRVANEHVDGTTIRLTNVPYADGAIARAGEKVMVLTRTDIHARDGTRVAAQHERQPWDKREKAGRVASGSNVRDDAC